MALALGTENKRQVIIASVLGVILVYATLTVPENLSASSSEVTVSSLFRTRMRMVEAPPNTCIWSASRLRKFGVAKRPPETPCDWICGNRTWN